MNYLNQDAKEIKELVKKRPIGYYNSKELQNVKKVVKHCYIYKNKFIAAIDNVIDYCHVSGHARGMS